MVARPAVTPVTTPPATVAFALLLLQAPPGAASVNVIVLPVQTAVGPVMVPVTSAAPTVITALAVADPQLLVTTYVIVSVPGVTPVTTPPETVAEALLRFHTPPGVASVNVIVEPVQTADGPVIVPAVGIPVLTAITAVAAVDPQELVTV